MSERERESKRDRERERKRVRERERERDWLTDRQKKTTDKLVVSNPMREIIHELAKQNEART